MRCLLRIKRSAAKALAALPSWPVMPVIRATRPLQFTAVGLVVIGWGKGLEGEIVVVIAAPTLEYKACLTAQG